MSQSYFEAAVLCTFPLAFLEWSLQDGATELAYPGNQWHLTVFESGYSTLAGSSRGLELEVASRVEIGMPWCRLGPLKTAVFIC
jgi:hypothetical protein